MTLLDFLGTVGCETKFTVKMKMFGNNFYSERVCLEDFGSTDCKEFGNFNVMSIDFITGSGIVVTVAYNGKRGKE